VTATPTGDPDCQRGFALLVLLAIIGAGSVGLLLAVQASVGAFADRPLRTEQNLVTAGRAMRAAFRANGQFPTDLDALGSAAGLVADGDWRRDPWYAPNDLDYRTVSTGRRVRSRGADRRLNTADDAVAIVAAEPLVRARQRGRLRLIRAVLLRSPYYLTGAMTLTDQATMRSALREQAAARRAWLTADAATRATLQATLTASEATITTLRLTYGLSALPTRTTGGTGLMAQLGMPDAKAIDGNRRTLLADPLLGVLARGYDRRRGTDDDM
jgi:type II secretory pathway pseudopilin PulG